MASSVYGDQADSWSWPVEVSDDVLKTKRDTCLISIEEDVQQFVYAESKGHVIDDFVRPYDARNAYCVSTGLLPS